MEIHKIKNKEFSKLWPEITRLENPQNYFVDLSKNLWNSHQDLLNKYSNKYI